MMSKSSNLVWFLFLSLFFTNSLFAQQHPDDPGLADTLYFEAGEPCSENGDTLYIPSDTSGGDVTIYVKIWNDNPIQALTVPLIDTCGIGFLDSFKNNGNALPLCFQGSRVEDFDMKAINLSIYTDSHKVFYGAISFESNLPSGEGLFARMVYTIPPGNSSACICLDTSFYPPTNVLSFVRTDIVEGYVPILKKGCFQVAAQEETDVPENGIQRPYQVDLKQNYPNPFNSLTTISFAVCGKQSTVNSPIHITISVYNILGQKVRVLQDQKQYPGEYQVFWDGKDDNKRDVGSGIYFYSLYFEDVILIKKMLLLR
jgi:hypothetical protein